MKPKQYRINEGRVFGFHVIEQRTDLNWEPISRPMDRESAQSALEQLNSREYFKIAAVVESNDVPEQGVVSRPVSAS
jgi:ABC-type xylose transport system substrate-binding protein